MGTGWKLTHVTGFGDGNRVVGRGRLNGIPRGFVLEVTSVPGDLNGDGRVNGADLGILLGAWGSAGGAADINHDGIVDGADIGMLLANWTGA